MIEYIEIAVIIGTVIGASVVTVVRHLSGKKSKKRITNLINELLQKFGCNRIIMMHYHNGSHYTGNRRQKMTVFCEEVNGVSRMADYYEKVAINDEVHRLVGEMVTKGHAFFEMWSGVYSDEVKNRYKYWGIHSAYIFPVYVKDHIKYSLMLCWGDMRNMNVNDVEHAKQAIRLIQKHL